MTAEEYVELRRAACVLYNAKLISKDEWVRIVDEIRVARGYV